MATVDRKGSGTLRVKVQGPITSLVQREVLRRQHCRRVPAGGGKLRGYSDYSSDDGKHAGLSIGRRSMRRFTGISPRSPSPTYLATTTSATCWRRSHRADVTLLNPADAIGQPMRTEQVRQQLSAALGFGSEFGISGARSHAAPRWSRLAAHRMNGNSKDRRAFLRQASAALGIGCVPAFAESDAQRPEFRTANSRWQAAYNRALGVLAAKVQVLPRYNKPVLIEGANYAGIWMECGPHEALVYRETSASTSRATVTSFFFALQRPDGHSSRITRSRKRTLGRFRCSGAARRDSLGTGPIDRRR